MSKVAQLYDMSLSEANALSNLQVNQLMERAGEAVESLMQTNPVFKQALKQKLLTSRRIVLGR
jgi:NAD(P)H-hydrate repair Nnr-like enzyme with NAD(P)H-hydrate epimerase domain